MSIDWYSIQKNMRAVSSSLSVTDALELFKDVFDRHSQITIRPLRAFDQYLGTISYNLPTEDTSEFVELMRRSAANFHQAVLSINASVLQEEDIRVITTILALSSAVDTTPNFDFFRMNAGEVIRHPTISEKMTNSLIPSVIVLMTAIFTFWLSLDQIRTHENLRNMMDFASTKGTMRLISSDQVTCEWFLILMKQGFDSNLRTIFLDDKLLLVAAIEE